MEIKRNPGIRAEFDKIEQMEKELKAFRKQKRAEIQALEQEVVAKEQEFIAECRLLDEMIKEHHAKILHRNKQISKAIQDKKRKQQNERKN